MNFFIFFYVFQNTVFEKKKIGYNHVTVSSMNWGILVCDMESCYKNISKNRNVTFILQNLQKKIEKIQMNSKKSINLLKMQIE